MGTLGDPKEHFVEIFRYLGTHIAPEGLPKKARRPPEEFRHCVLVDYGVQAEPPNRNLFDSACKKCVLICTCFLSAVWTQSGVAFWTARGQILSQNHGRGVQNQGFKKIEKTMCWVSY